MIVMITGASRGIGFATTRYFARLDNAKVFALSRNREGFRQLVTECAGLNRSSQVHPLVFDLDVFLNNPDSLQSILPAGIEHIDILINNAGSMVKKPFKETDLPEIEKVFRINCFAPALLIKQLLPLMGHGRITHIVNISSMGGFQGSMKYPGLAYYSASKAALACLTECMSEEFKDSDIVFNCLALGSVQTEMFEEAFPGYKAGIKPDEIAEFIGYYAINGHKHMRGKIIPVSITNP